MEKVENLVMENDTKIGHVILVAITGITILVSYLSVKSLQLM